MTELTYILSDPSSEQEPIYNRDVKVVHYISVNRKNLFKRILHPMEERYEKGNYVRCRPIGTSVKGNLIRKSQIKEYQ